MNKKIKLVVDDLVSQAADAQSDFERATIRSRLFGVVMALWATQPESVTHQYASAALEKMVSQFQAV